MSRPEVETVEILRGRDSFAVEIRQGIFWQGQYLKTTEAAHASRRSDPGVGARDR